MIRVRGLSFVGFVPEAGWKRAIRLWGLATVCQSETVIEMSTTWYSICGLKKAELELQELVLCLANG